MNLLQHEVAEAAAPQLMWANILVICAGLLLALALLTFARGWIRRFSRPTRLGALLPLAASVFAALAAHHLDDTYAYWVAFLPTFLVESHAEPLVAQVTSEFDSANHDAAVLGWVGIILTGLLLALSLLSLWRLRRTAVPLVRQISS